MPSPFDWLRYLLGTRAEAAEPDVSPQDILPGPPPTRPEPLYEQPPWLPTRPSAARVQVRDERDVPPTKSFRGNYLAEPLERAAAAAQTHGVDPNLALAMAIQESAADLTNPYVNDVHGQITFQNWKGPLGLTHPAEESAILHLIDRAASVGSGAPLDLQVQAYNGLGRIPRDGRPMYGTTEPLTGREDRPYGRRVLDVAENVVRKSPALQALIRSAKPTFTIDDLGQDELEATMRAMTARIRNPNLLGGH